jgi:hypothetical protein
VVDGQHTESTTHQQMNKEDEERFIKEVLEFFDQEQEEFSIECLLPEPQPLQYKSEEKQKKLTHGDKDFSNIYEILSKKTPRIPETKQHPTDGKVILQKMATLPEHISDKPQLYIKPARKTPKYYISYFPDKIYCSPYKYDLLIQIPTELYEKYEVEFTYIDSETNEPIPFNHKGKPALDVGKTKITTRDEDKVTEILYRVCFTVCSFHHYRRPFILKVSLKNPNLPEEEITFFKSQPFQTFARKNEMEDTDAWISDEEDSPKRRRKIKMEEEEEEEEEEDEEVKPLKRRKIMKGISLDEMDPCTTFENLV